MVSAFLFSHRHQIPTYKHTLKLHLLHSYHKTPISPIFILSVYSSELITFEFQRKNKIWAGLLKDQRGSWRLALQRWKRWKIKGLRGGIILWDRCINMPRIKPPPTTKPWDALRLCDLRPWLPARRWGRPSWSEREISTESWISTAGALVLLDFNLVCIWLRLYIYVK